jgi:hypothetical protein
MNMDGSIDIGTYAGLVVAAIAVVGWARGQWPKIIDGREEIFGVLVAVALGCLVKWLTGYSEAARFADVLWPDHLLKLVEYSLIAILGYDKFILRPRKKAAEKAAEKP